MKRGKRLWQRMLTIVCLGVFIYSGTAIGFELFGYYQNRQVLAKAQTMYGHQEEMTEKREPGKIRSSFDELRKVNEDIVGWINMKDTMIQYPIVQSRDNAFYLTRNYLKKTPGQAVSLWIIVMMSCMKAQIQSCTAIG